MTESTRQPGHVRDLDAFRKAYSAFLQPGRILLSGHSHQAWPDCAREAQLRVFDDAARLVDEKWTEVIHPKMEAVGRRVAARMGLPGHAIGFGESTHEVVFRLLTCFEWADRPRIVTTTSEFHSLYRQLRRLEEEGPTVEWVNATPREGLAGRLVEALTPGTALLAVSSVFYEDASLLVELPAVLERAREVGATILVDAYHSFNVVPLDLGPAGADAYVTAGGYKYAQFGNGLSWLALPASCALRPVYTGWFSDFAGLTRPRGEAVRYGEGGARFAGATFDPSALYRAEAVLDHWDRFGLGVAELRAISSRQTRRIIEALEAGGLARLGARVSSSHDDAQRGGFVTVVTPKASAVVAQLRQRGVFTDSRGDLLRLGPAPYLTDEEIDAGVAAVLEELR